MERMTYGAVDLNLLLVLDRLIAHRSVTGASRDLGLSQSATSRALQRLRDALGDELLARAGADMVLTDRARELAGPVAQALEAARAVFEPPPTFELATATGALHLALGDELQPLVAPAVLGALRARAPGVDLRVRALSVGSVDEARRGLLDLAIAPDLDALPAIAGAVDTSELVARSLYARRFVVIAARGRFLPQPCGPTALPPLPLADWLAADHAIVSFEGGDQGFVDTLLAARGASRRIAATASSFSAVAEIVAQTRLVAVVPHEVTRGREDRLTAFDPPIALPTLPMRLLWHPRQTTRARHRALRELVAEAALAAVADPAA